MIDLRSWAEQLARRGREVPPLLVDAAIAIGCYLTLTVHTVVDGQASVGVMLLTVGNTLPLLWRRRFPFTVTLVVGIFTTILALVDALGAFPAAQVVATYTFAALCPPMHRLVAALGTAVGVTVSVLVPKESVLSLGTASIMFVVAYALGTSARARRNRIQMLEERARRLTEEQAAATVRERQRIAREMHDILAHSMSLVVIQAEAGPVAVRTDPDRAERAFDTISMTAREALAQVRRALGVLRQDEPGTPDRAPQPGLDGLPGLVEAVRQAGLTATLEERGDPPPMAPDLAATTYRIVQESLTNTLKHAHASSVGVRLEWRDGALWVEVRDDGRGPAGNGAPEGGHGLVGMRERVAAAGGELATGPGPDGVGFRVSARLPLQ